MIHRTLAIATMALALSCASAFAQNTMADRSVKPLNIAPNTVRVPGSALAASPISDAAAAPFCAKDAARICPMVPEGRHRIGQCLYDNKPQIADGSCKNAIISMDKGLDAKWPCRQDVMKFCATIKPGDNRIGKCLSRYEDQVSSSCKAFRKGAADALAKSPIDVVKKLESQGGPPVWHEGLR